MIWNGVHIHTFPPFITMYQLLVKNFSLHDENKPLVNQPITNFVGILKSKVNILLHQYRPIKNSGLPDLESFKKIDEEYQREIEFMVLTGRAKDKHELTKKALEKAGYTDYFSRFLFNEFTSATLWKGQKAQELIGEGFNVVHLEDDLRAALCVARVNAIKLGPHRIAKQCDPCKKF